MLYFESEEKERSNELRFGHQQATALDKESERTFQEAAHIIIAHVHCSEHVFEILHLVV